MRFPPFSDLRSRDGTLLRGPRVINGYVETTNKQTFVQKRPALALLDATLTGVGGGLWTDPVSTLGSVGISGTGTFFSLLAIPANVSYSFISTPYPLLGIGALAQTSSPALVLISNDAVYTKPSALSTTTTQVFSGAAFVNHPHAALTLGTDIWVQPVDTNFVAYSSDGGSTWTAVIIAAHSSPITSGIFVLGGTLFACIGRTLYYSATPKVAASYTLAGMSFSGGSSFDDSNLAVDRFGIGTKGALVYTIGGNSGVSSNYQDICSSSDGINFTFVARPTIFSARNRPIVLGTSNGNLFLVGGCIGQNFPRELRDVWRSSDGGVTWVDNSPSGGFVIAGGAVVADRPVLWRLTSVSSPTADLAEGAAGESTYQATSQGSVANSNSVLASFASTP